MYVHTEKRGRKEQMKRRLIFILLTLVMIMTGVFQSNTLTAKAQKLKTRECTDGVWLDDDVLNYKVNKDGTVTIMGWQTGKITKLVVPSKINGRKVTKIASGAIPYDNKIEEIKLPNTITSIGEGAFEGCRNLRKVNIPAKVKTIKKETFAGCRRLNLVIPANVSKIETGAFDAESIWASGGINSIKVSSKNTKYITVDGVLFNKSQTKLIYYPRGKQGEYYQVPDSVKSIEEGAFQHAKVTEVLVPVNVEKIGKEAFNNSSKTVTILNPDCKIGKNALIPYYPSWGIQISDEPTDIEIIGYEGSTAEKYVKKMIKKHPYLDGYLTFEPVVME